MQITHIIKNNFFFAFKHIFYIIINPKNIQANFRITNLILYNPKKIISNLDFKFHILTPSNSHPTNSISTNPNTPHTAKNAVQNSINLKNKIAKHQNNFFIHLYKLIDTQIKSISKLTHKMVLLEIKNKTFHTTNKLLNKQKKIKKICVRIKQSLNISKASALQFLKNKIHTEKTNMSKNNNYMKEIISHVQHCSKCNQPRHNT